MYQNELLLKKEKEKEKEQKKSTHTLQGTNSSSQMLHNAQTAQLATIKITSKLTSSTIVEI